MPFLACCNFFWNQHQSTIFWNKSSLRVKQFTHPYKDQGMRQIFVCKFLWNTTQLLLSWMFWHKSRMSGSPVTCNGRHHHHLCFYPPPCPIFCGKASGMYNMNCHLLNIVPFRMQLSNMTYFRDWETNSYIRRFLVLVVLLLRMPHQQSMRTWLMQKGWALDTTLFV